MTDVDEPEVTVTVADCLTELPFEAVTVSAKAPLPSIVPIRSTAERPTGVSDNCRNAERKDVGEVHRIGGRSREKDPRDFA